MASDKKLTVAQVAKMAHCSVGTVRNAFKSGALVGEEEDGKFVFLPTVVAGWIVAREYKSKATEPVLSSDDVNEADLKEKARFQRDQDRHDAERRFNLEMEDRERQRRHEQELADKRIKEHELDIKIEQLRGRNDAQARRQTAIPWVPILGVAAAAFVLWRKSNGESIPDEQVRAAQEKVSQAVGNPSDPFADFLRAVGKTPAEPALQDALEAMVEGDVKPLEAWLATATPEQQRDAKQRIEELVTMTAEEERTAQA